MRLYFTYRNTRVNFIVTLFVRCKLKWAICTPLVFVTSFTYICRNLLIYFFLFYDLSYIQLKSLIGFSRLTIYKVRTSSTLIAFLIKIINKIRSNNQIRSYSETVILRHHWTCFDGFYIITDTNYKLLVSTSLCLQLDSNLLPISS